MDSYKPYNVNNEDNYLAVNYIKFLPLLVNSLKELSTRVRELSTKTE
jgi:hypothetical protein